MPASVQTLLMSAPVEFGHSLHVHVIEVVTLELCYPDLHKYFSIVGWVDFCSYLHYCQGDTAQPSLHGQAVVMPCT